MSSPTPRQMRYLKALALQTGTSFAYPKTRVQASSEIDRLLELKRNGGRPLPEASTPDPRAYSPSYRPDEVAGFGGSATWANARSRIAEKTELARYKARGVERVVYRQDVKGAVRLVDKPADGNGRSYLIDGDLRHDDEGLIAGLVGDYVAQARELNAIPMATSVVGLELERERAA